MPAKRNKDLIRSEWRVPLERYKLVQLLAKSRKRSINDLVNEFIEEGLKRKVLSGEIQVEQAESTLPTATAVKRLMQIENATLSAREFRWMGEAGKFPSSSAMNEVRRLSSPEIRSAIRKDIGDNGPVIWRGPDDPEKLTDEDRSAYDPNALTDDGASIEEALLIDEEAVAREEAGSAMLADLNSFKR